MRPASASIDADIISAAEIRTELEKVLASAELVRCPQLQRFLNFVVEEELGGRGDQLKEYVLAVGVFGRPADFDPRLDSLVRVEARRLRAALQRYYAANGRHDPIIIELQKGAYLPSFHRVSLSEGPQAVSSSLGKEGENSQSVRTRAPASRKAWRWRVSVVAVIAAALGIAAGAYFLRARHAVALTERDSIVLAEFDNSTGDPAFDDALKQGLAMALEQSPFLNIISDRRVTQTLKLMGRSPTEHLNLELAREVCLRTGSRATVEGSIGRMGSQYVIGLTATNCGTGDSLAHLLVEAGNREAVLTALGTAAVDLRHKLGESLSSTQKFDTPIEEATTPSLEALQAYSLGRKTAREKGSPADIPFYQRAIELDPNFAVAYAALAISYINLGQPSVASQYAAKAYELREHVSEREKYRIAANYYHLVSGELEKSAETYEQWRQSYPRDFAPYINLGVGYIWLGEYEKSVTVTKEALRIEPNNVIAYTNLAGLYIKLGRPADAKSILDEAQAHNLRSKFLRSNLYYLAFLRGDSAAMEQQLDEVRDKPGDEDPLLSQQSDTEAYYGHLRRARELSRQAVESATRAKAKEAAAGWLVNAALREAEYGNGAEARREVAEALRLAAGRDVKAVAALGLARAGDVPGAEGLLRSLEKEYPANTVIRVYWAPTIRAAIAIQKGNAQAALDLLQSVAPYELGSPPPMGLATLYPVYLRGQAHLLARQGDAAAREFQKILDHPYLVLNFPLHALADLQLARAQAPLGDQAQARRAYHDFLTLWKDADSDIPVLKSAQTEFARLR
jgi:tetratricopeptide (TPR) repeat protein